MHLKLTLINKLANLSRKSSVTKWHIKTKYKIGGSTLNVKDEMRSLGKSTDRSHIRSQYLINKNTKQKHTYITKQNRAEGREKNRRRSRQFRNEEQRKNSTGSMNASSIEANVSGFSNSPIIDRYTINLNYFIEFET